jgi:hypothetical protein
MADCNGCDAAAAAASERRVPGMSPMGLERTGKLLQSFQSRAKPGFLFFFVSKANCSRTWVGTEMSVRRQINKSPELKQPSWICF